MFEFLFKYPATVFSKGQFVLLSAWPAWVLGLAILAIAAGLGWHMTQRRGFLTGARPVAIWLLETLLAALVLFLLWHPAIRDRKSTRLNSSHRCISYAVFC